MDPWGRSNMSTGGSATTPQARMPGVFRGKMMEDVPGKTLRKWKLHKEPGEKHGKMVMNPRKVWCLLGFVAFYSWWCLFVAKFDHGISWNVSSCAINQWHLLRATVTAHCLLVGGWQAGNPCSSTMFWPWHMFWKFFSAGCPKIIKICWSSILNKTMIFWELKIPHHHKMVPHSLLSWFITPITMTYGRDINIYS